MITVELFRPITQSAEPTPALPLLHRTNLALQILEHALVEDQVELIKELEPVISKVIKDQHGNHVIQKILTIVPREYTDFIINSFRGRVHDLSKNIYACRLIQRVLESGNDADKAMVMEEIDACYGSLFVDQYGNYVTQHVIKYGHPDDQTKMKNLVIADLLTLSKHKFASNVVETCMDSATPEQLRTIRQVLTSPAEDGTDPLPTMIKDQYGNYVIRKLAASRFNHHEVYVLIESRKISQVAREPGTSAVRLRVGTAALRLEEGLRWQAAHRHRPPNRSPFCPAAGGKRIHRTRFANTGA